MKKRYHEILENFKNNYFKIGTVACPVMNCMIIFNEAGFRHFLRKSRGVRPIKDQLRRFKLFTNVIEIIASSNTSVAEHFTSTKEISFCCLINKSEYPQIKVIIRKTQRNNWHYYSVMNYKQK